MLTFPDRAAQFFIAVSAQFFLGFVTVLILYAAARDAAVGVHTVLQHTLRIASPPRLWIPIHSRLRRPKQYEAWFRNGSRRQDLVFNDFNQTPAILNNSSGLRKLSFHQKVPDLIVS